MILDAIVKVRNIDKDRQRVEVYSPRYPKAKPLMTLSDKYIGRPIKFVTSWDDIPVKCPVTMNGSVVPDEIVGKCNLARGMCVGCDGDDTIYIMMPKQLIS